MMIIRETYNKDIFISYSRHDKEIVFPFVKRIEQELDTTCWIDYEGIESGAQFEEVIVNAIEASKVVLFMLSDNSINSQWTKREILYAEDENKRIVPIVIDGKKLRKWFKFHFGNVDYIDLNEDEQCEKLFNNLATWIGVKRTIIKEQGLDKKIQIRISDDKNVITIPISDGVDLILKKDIEKNCYIGEIPINKILTFGKEEIKFAAKGVFGATSSLMCMALSPIVGLVVGSVVGCKLMEEHLENKSKKEVEIFQMIVSELNRKYRIHLKKRKTDSSDYTVEIAASEMSKLI